MAMAQTDHEREFFDYAIRARDRLGSRKGPIVGSGSPPNPNQGKKEWIQERVRDSLRFGYYYARAAKDRLKYLRFHARGALDPEAPARGDLRLPGLTSFIYRVLEPARARKR